MVIGVTVKNMAMVVTHGLTVVFTTVNGLKMKNKEHLYFENFSKIDISFLIEKNFLSKFLYQHQKIQIYKPTVRRSNIAKKTTKSQISDPISSTQFY